MSKKRRKHRADPSGPKGISRPEVPPVYVYDKTATSRYARDIDGRLNAKAMHKIEQQLDADLDPRVTNKAIQNYTSLLKIGLEAARIDQRIEETPSGTLQIEIIEEPFRETIVEEDDPNLGLTPPVPVAEHGPQPQSQE